MDASPSGPKHDPVPGQTVPAAVTVTESPASTRPVDAPGTPRDPTVYTLVTVDGPAALCAAATSATKAATTNADPLRLLMIPLSITAVPGDTASALPASGAGRLGRDPSSVYRC
jgi:hypothetical protein